jgi:hypothetical protein
MTHVSIKAEATVQCLWHGTHRLPLRYRVIDLQLLETLLDIEGLSADAVHIGLHAIADDDNVLPPGRLSASIVVYYDFLLNRPDPC